MHVWFHLDLRGVMGCHQTMAQVHSALHARTYSLVPFVLFLLASISGITRAHGGSGDNARPVPIPGPGNPNVPVCPTSGAPFPADLIQPHEPANAGTIEGTFSVDGAGSGRYELPLVAVPGRVGMTPQVSLVCDGGGDGSLGVGCSLEGFSRVTRCPKNLAQDGVMAPIAYDASDALCLDGRRLVRVSSSNQVDEYRTIPDSFSKIEAFYPSNWIRALGPKNLRVSTKAGVTVDYGATVDSRARAKNGATRAWWINRTTDRSGNFTEYTYSNLQDTTDPSQPFTNELLPNRITYTGHTNMPGTRTVSFQYVTRVLDAVRTTFAGGMALVDSNLLQAVEMRGPGNALARRYELSYASSASTGRSQLAEIAECAGIGGPCKPPTRFTWNNPPSGFDDIETDLPFPQYEGASVITTDWDGNGLDDIITIDGEPSGVPVSRFYTARNVGAAEGYFRHPYTAAFFLDFNVYPTSIRERGTPIDYNHDGRQDLFLHDMNGNSTRWKVLQTNALGQFSMAEQIPGLLAHFPVDRMCRQASRVQTRPLICWIWMAMAWLTSLLVQAMVTELVIRGHTGRGPKAAFLR
jgi:hypothetical protein